MTEKLFYQDSHLTDFEGRVLSCAAEKDNYALVLDRTAFYPEGGGQPSDLGFINDIPVVFVKEVAGEIRHYVTAPIEPGASVRGRVDQARRRDLMQQHSGEHIASGLICSHFHCENVGFHISDPFVTIDYNASFSWEALLQVEDAANQAIWENRPVRAWFPSPAELQALPYRSKKPLEGDVRIVEYPGVDICACCGTHVSFTGEVGLIKFLSCEPHRGGVRIQMLSGERALRYVQTILAQNHEISVTLSAKESETAAAVKRIYQELLAARARLATLESRATEERARALSGTGNCLLEEENLSVDATRRLAAAVMESCGGLCAVLSDCGEEGIRYCLGQVDGDLGALAQALNDTFSGRGGGKPHFVQGTLHGSMKEIKSFLEGYLK